MDIKDIQKVEKKEVRINLKITKRVSNWLRRNNISPQKLFDASVEELMEKEN